LRSRGGIRPRRDTMHSEKRLGGKWDIASQRKDVAATHALHREGKNIPGEKCRDDVALTNAANVK
jgi:hypothetical protein